MRTLVTGGAGFIGSHLVDALLKEGHEVVVVDNFHTGSADNLRHIQNDIRLIRGDVADLRCYLEGPLDCILHLGMPSSSPMYVANPLLLGEVVRGAVQVFWTAVTHDVRRVVYASSSSMYSGLPLPYREDMTPPVNDLYTEGRISLERLAQFFYLTHGVSSVGLRMFSVYGDREEAKGQYGNLVSQFLAAMQKGDSPVLYGDGTQTRDFTFVEDVVEAWMAALRHPQCACCVCNVGTGVSHSLNELVELLNDALGSDLLSRYVGNPLQNYVERTRADTSLAEKMLGFRAKVGLAEGIQRLLGVKWVAGAPAG